MDGSVGLWQFGDGELFRGERLARLAARAGTGSHMPLCPPRIAMESKVASWPEMEMASSASSTLECGVAR